MWRFEDVRMRRCEDVRMWRWEDVKMWGCEDEKMWRCEDAKMRRCEDEQMWRWEDVRMWRCEDVRMRRFEAVKMFDRPPLLEEPFAQTLSGKTALFFEKATLGIESFAVARPDPWQPFPCPGSCFSTGFKQRGQGSRASRKAPWNLHSFFLEGSSPVKPSAGWWFSVWQPCPCLDSCFSEKIQKVQKGDVRHREPSRRTRWNLAAGRFVVARPSPWQPFPRLDNCFSGGFGKQR